MVSLVKDGEVGVFYTKALRMLAIRGLLDVVWTTGLPWFEIDTIEDLRAIGPSAREIAHQFKVLDVDLFGQARCVGENHT